jgi:predicted RNase H-like nuclease (RuvC/YqgF family)
MSSQEGSSEIYMGVDIEYGSPLSTINRARYSVVLIDQSLRLIAKYQSVVLPAIVRLAWEHRPKYIASDNVLELSPDGSTESLARLLSLLPPGTALVQATATSEGLLDVLEAARRAGIDVASSKLSPMRTAFIVAAIVAKGGGRRVGFSREKTYIVVSRGRSSKSGGWSQARYQRRIRASVKIAADKVKEALDNANIDYDVFYRSGDGGLESAVFIVYAPRERLVGLVRPHRGIDYMIKVETKYEGELTFGESSERPSRPLIVGVDAGMTTGIAVLDVEGRLLHLGSYKELDRGEIVKLISELGRPIIVATDVSDPPELIRKLAAQLGAQLYLPGYDLSVAEKEYMASKASAGSDLKPKTSHERDSLAAAYKAFIDYHNKLSQVEAYTSRLGLDIDVDELKADVIRGATLAEAIEKQISRLLGDHESQQQERRSLPATDSKVQQGPCNENSRLELLEAQKVALTKQLEELRDRLFHEERELYLARKQLKAELLKDSEINSLVKRVGSLESTLSDLRKSYEALQEDLEALRKALLQVVSGSLVMARRLDELKRSSLKRSEDLIGPIRPGEVVIVDSTTNFEAEVLSELASAGVKALLLQETEGPLPNAAKKYGIAPLNINNYQVVRAAGYHFVSSKVLQDATDFARKIKSDEFVNAKLSQLLSEYRSMRALGSKDRRAALT